MSNLGSTFAICAVVFLIMEITIQVMDNTALVNIFAPIAMIACMQNNISILPVASALTLFCMLTNLSTISKKGRTETNP